MFVNFFRWSAGYQLMKPDKVKDILETNKVEMSDISDGNYVKVPSSIDVTKFEVRASINDEREAAKLNSHNYKKILREMLNIPFLAGLIAVIISTLPIVGPYCADPSSVFYKLFVGKYNI